MSRHLSTRNISSKSMHAFLSNLANRQTDRQTRAKTFTSSFVGGNNSCTQTADIIITSVQWQLVRYWFVSPLFVCLFVITMKLSGEIINGVGIMLFNWPGGSTLQWGTGRGLLHPPTPVIIIYTHLESTRHQSNWIGVAGSRYVRGIG